MLIRFYALNDKFRRVSHYIQGRTIATHTADGLFAGFVEALTKATANVPDVQIRLTEEEVYEKSAVFPADGASVNGVRRKGPELLSEVFVTCLITFAWQKVLLFVCVYVYVHHPIFERCFFELRIRREELLQFASAKAR